MKPSVMKYRNYTFHYIPGPKTIFPILLNVEYSTNTYFHESEWERIEIPGQLHRIDGPAIIMDNKNWFPVCDWYYLGKKVNARSQVHFYQLTCKLKDILF